MVNTFENFEPKNVQKSIKTEESYAINVVTQN